MKLKKITSFLLLIVLFNVSCKKDLLVDESSILIGKWQKTKIIYEQRPYNLCSVETFNANCSSSLEFEKDGDVIWKKEGTEQEYTMSFNNIEDAFNQRDELEFIGCSGNTLDSIENHYNVYPSFYLTKGGDALRPLIFVNETKMIIRSEKKDFAISTLGDHRFIYYHVFVKTN